MLCPLEANFDFHYKIKTLLHFEKRNCSKKVLRNQKVEFEKFYKIMFAIEDNQKRRTKKKRKKKEMYERLGLGRIIVFVIKIATKIFNNWNNTECIQINRSFGKRKLDFAKQK